MDRFVNGNEMGTKGGNEMWKDFVESFQWNEKVDLGTKSVFSGGNVFSLEEAKA